jgi:hypothetical protein
MRVGKFFPRPKTGGVNVTAVCGRKYDRGIAALDYAKGLGVLRFGLNDRRRVFLSGHRIAITKLNPEINVAVQRI